MCQLCSCICQKQTKKLAVLLLAVLSDQEHMTTQSESRSTYMLLLERELLIYVSLFQSD